MNRRSMQPIFVTLAASAVLPLAACSASNDEPPAHEGWGSSEGVATSALEETQAACTGPAEARARKIVAQMTLDEKIDQLHGIRTATVFRFVPPVARLGVPALLVTNGPAGVGPGDVVQSPATALPAPIGLAATWDVHAATKYGDIQGEELRDVGRNFLEAPDINMARVPLNGRTFEAYGEDPYLAGRLSVADIRAIQRHGVIANVKHYLGNNQEANRFAVSDAVDERTLREIYLPAFEASVREGHAQSVMCAYPKINGTFSCENGTFLTDVLKKEWGFDGFVTSDFGAVHSTAPSANAGLDLEMPTGIFFGDALKSAVQAGQVAEAVLDDKLIRRYTKMIEAGIFDRDAATTPIPAQEHGAIARALAEEAMVLLRNESVNGAPLLPLRADRLQKVALIGPYAGAAHTGGGGSSKVKPLYTVSPRDGLASRLPTASIDYQDGSNLATAASSAAAADVAIVMVGDSESEGSDRKSLALANQQDDLVSAVIAANPRTIVVVKSGGPVLMPWIARAPAVLEAWYPGEEDGNAVAAVLFGAVNPSGKLPITFPVRESDMPTASSPERYPGVNGTAAYSEGVFIGYRHYDQNAIEPLFPFGFGLSYTTFSFARLQVERRHGARDVSGSIEVTNRGGVHGAEVVQVYVGDPSSAEVPEPPSQLKAFERVELEPGETRRIHFELPARSFAHWDTSTHAWKVSEGTYTIKVGNSSRHLPLVRSVVMR